MGHSGHGFVTSYVRYAVIPRTISSEIQRNTIINRAKDGRELRPFFYTTVTNPVLIRLLTQGRAKSCVIRAFHQCHII